MIELFWQGKEIETNKIESVEIMDKKYFLELKYKESCLTKVKTDSLAVRHDFKMFAIEGYVYREKIGDEWLTYFIIVVDEDEIKKMSKM